MRASLCSFFVVVLSASAFGEPGFTGSFAPGFSNAMAGELVINGDSLQGNDGRYTTVYDNDFGIHGNSFVSLVTTLTVALDLKPQSCPNPFNVFLLGLMPAAILGSPDFDVNEIDVSSLLLAGALVPIEFNFEDVAAPVVDPQPCECTTAGPDGFDDLTLKFDSGQLAELLEVGTQEVCITGNLIDGTPFTGCDCLVVFEPPVPTSESSLGFLKALFDN